MTPQSQCNLPPFLPPPPRGPLCKITNLVHFCHFCHYFVKNPNQIEVRPHKFFLGPFVLLLCSLFILLPVLFLPLCLFTRRTKRKMPPKKNKNGQENTIPQNSEHPVGEGSRASMLAPISSDEEGVAAVVVVPVVAKVAASPVSSWGGCWQDLRTPR